MKHKLSSIKTLFLAFFLLISFYSFSQPVVVGYSPEPGATNVARDADLFLTFDQPVYTGTGQVTIKRYDTDATVWVGGPSHYPDFLEISGSTLIIHMGTRNPFYEEILNNQEYYVQMASSAVVGAGMFYPSSISDKDQWSFTIEAGTPPMITHFSPADGSTIPSGSDVEVTFDQQIRAGTGFVRIRNSATDQVLFSARPAFDPSKLEISGNKLTILLSQLSFAEETDIYITVGNNSIIAEGGNVFVDEWTDSETWNLTVEAALPAPSIKYQFPENGATEMEIDLYGNDLAFDFEEDVSTGSGAVVLIKNYANDELIESIDIANQTYSGGSVEVPVTPLPYATKMYILIEPAGTITSDNTGLSFSGLDDKDDWTFTTGAAPVAPVITTLSPAVNATNVPANSSLTIDFDVAVYVSSDVSVEIRDYLTDALVESLLIAEAAYVDQPIVLTPVSDLPTNTQLYAILGGSGYIEGYDCNCTEFEGLTSKDDWSFTTAPDADTTPPVPVALSPAEGSDNVPVDQVFSITFDEDVLPPSSTFTGFIRIILADGSQLINIPYSTASITDGWLSVSGNVVSFSRGTLATDQSYYVSIDDNTLADLDGNKLTGYAWMDTWWIFTTESPSVSVTWNGISWSNTNGPTYTDEVTIAGDYTFSEDGIFECDNLIVNSGATLLVDGAGTFIVNGSISNNGHMTIASGASLITYSGNAITGNWIDVKRTTRYGDGKYSFVGTPMSLATFNNGVSIGNPTYQYSEYEPYGADGLGRWESVNELHYLQPGQGYAQAFKQELTFTGRPNSGTINYAASYTEDTDDAKEGWHLVSNPYPAAIFIDAFLDANMNTTDAIYIWDDNGSDTGRGSNNDYIVANKTAATDNNAIDGLGPNSEGRWNGHIGSAQGFFVKLDGVAGSITFTEEMRVSGNNSDGNFFRKAKNEIPLLRMNLTHTEGLIRQTIVGWNEAVSNEELAEGYDAKVFSTTADYQIYTSKANSLLAIQTVNSQVAEIPVGIRVAEAGTYSIEFKLEHFVGSLYLLDNETGDRVSVNDWPYSFATSAGHFADRFVLTTASGILAMDDQKVNIYAVEKVLHIEMAGFQPAEYLVYNLSGKRIMQVLISGTTKIDLNHVLNGVYLISDGMETKKIILK